MKTWKIPKIYSLNTKQIQSGNSADIKECEGIVYTCGTNDNCWALGSPPDMTYQTGKSSSCYICQDLSATIAVCS